MPKIELSGREALYPVPVVLVSCRDAANGRDNIIAIAWCGVASSKPPILSISLRPSRFSHPIIEKTGDFVVNIPTTDMVREVDFCGLHSGSEVDKFKSCNLHPVKSSKISSPLIQECPVNIECVVREKHRLGSHDMFLGEVVAVHVDGDLLDKDGRLSYEKADPIVYNQGEYWGIGRMLGKYGCSRTR
jgi:flavin reductase (DIM6/NTAB) family NADH-FMN oxidoreductase RutF